MSDVSSNKPFLTPETQAFGHRMAEVAAPGKAAYGASFMLNENEFDYYAAVELEPGKSVPQDMTTIKIPAGSFAHCTLTGLDKLGEGYTFLYGT